MHKLLALVLASSFATACGVEAPADDQYGGGGDGKADGASKIPWDKDIPFIVPERIHNYLQDYQWGVYHIDFHMTRRWFILGDAGRTWLGHVGEGPADVQEGDPGNGLEFLTMHRAMIENLRDRWGDEPVDNNEDGRTTFSGVLDGWPTDEDVIAHLEKVDGDVETFKKALVKVNDFASFATEDDFGLFLQTTLRLTGEVDPDDSAHRFYNQDQTPGAGIHNWLHGQFGDPSNPCDVGNPETNLSNQRFWGIHGWIEAKWEAFEKVHVRTPLEQAEYDEEMDRFRLHMQLHSDYSEQHHPHNVPPKTLVQKLAPEMFQNGAPCVNVSDDATLEGCTP